MRNFLSIMTLLAVLAAALSAWHCGKEKGSADGGDGGVDASTTHFNYASCLSPGKVFQYPNPNWEASGDSPTGVILQTPAADAAAKLLKILRPIWHEQFQWLDGFPLHAAWVVATDGAAASADPSKTRVFSLKGTALKEVPVEISAWVSDTNPVVVFRTAKSLPTPEKGGKYILALYKGVTGGGANPVPACGSDGKALGAYVDAADALTAAGYGKDLLFALPFTATRMSSQLAGVYKRLKSAPDLVVESIAERDYDYFKDLAPDAATKAVLAPRAYSGILSTPAYQADLGAFRIDASMELPAAQGRTKPGVVVALPKSGNAPYPLVVFQHGGGMHKADLFLVGKPYFASGFAMAGIDMPYHGDRSKEPGKNGSDTDMADFDAPLKSRDNFRQAAADHVALFTGLETLNAALKPLTGHDRTLDQSRVFFIGHSMGALTGAIASGAVQAYLGVGLFAGGALYRQLVSDGIFQVPIKDIFNERTKTEVEVMLALIQTLLDGGDPAAYPSRYEDPSLRPMEALIWECIRDPVVNNPATDFMGGAFGAQLLSPPHHNVYGMAGALPPVSGNYDRGDGAGSAVRLLIHRDYPATAVTALHSWIFYSDPVVHEKTAGCFRARADGGNCKFE